MNLLQGRILNTTSKEVGCALSLSLQKFLAISFLHTEYFSDLGVLSKEVPHLINKIFLCETKELSPDVFIFKIYEQILR